MDISGWIQQNWTAVLIPVIVFLAALIALFWLRNRLYRWVRQGLFRLGLEDEKVIDQAVRIPSIAWTVFIAAFMGVLVSVVPGDWKAITSRALWTVFGISLAISITIITENLLTIYGRRIDAPPYAIGIARNTTRLIIGVVALLAILNIWGLSTDRGLLIILFIVLVAVLLLRDAIPNFFATIQLAAGQNMKTGDCIKLESGEAGYITEIGWTRTQIKALDQSVIIIPNSHLVKGTVVNYGHPIKRAKELFRFNSRTEIRELTGIKARNLNELLTSLKVAPDSVIYYHTHSFLKEQHYITPEPYNDFALWVTDALGYGVLGERLASVDTFEFNNLGALRDRLSVIIQDYLSSDGGSRQAMEGREFHFMKSVSVIFPTAYIVTDLRNFVEALRKISLGSLYFHIFESRLRLGRGQNDFSIWMRDSLDEPELAEQIARLDPYTYTLEGLRLRLIQLTERHIR